MTTSKLEIQLQGYKQILEESQALDSKEHPGVEQIILLLNKLIRKTEIQLILDLYFEQRCYFGYFALLSQILEEQVRDLIRGVELISKFEKKNFYNTKDLEGKPLGALIAELEKYLKYTSLNELLNSFNKIRKSIIHHLIDDYTIKLDDLESQVIDFHLMGTYDEISLKISETGRRLSERLGETTLKGNPNKMFVVALSNKMNGLMGLNSEVIEFKF